MCERRIVIGGRGCQVYGDETAKNVIFWFTGEHEKDTIEEVYRQLKETTQVSFWLIACEIEDWNAQLSPWSAPAVYGKEGFAGEGAETLKWLEKECLPGLENIYQMKLEEKRLLIGGYSLSGLFAMWAFYELGIFTGAAACSASFWFPGWMEYTKQHMVHKKSRIYLSLGIKEEKTRNPVMAKVGEAARGMYQQLSEDMNVEKVTLEWNHGNHFTQPAERTMKGFAWLLS